MIYFPTPKKLKLLMTTANGLIKTMMKWPQGTLYAPVKCILVSRVHSLSHSPSVVYYPHSNHNRRNWDTVERKRENEWTAKKTIVIKIKIHRPYSIHVAFFLPFFSSRSFCVFFFCCGVLCSVLFCFVFVDILFGIATNYGSNFWPTAMRIFISYCLWNQTKHFDCAVAGIQV